MAIALRTSLIWHDEVMDDVVIDRPAPITLGASGASTFVVPELGLPPDFAVVRPGARGYTLTLGARMRGTICVGGERREVAEVVRAAGGAEYHALAIDIADWGVVELDDTGRCKLFFQFVDVGGDGWTVPRPAVVGADHESRASLAFSIVLHAALLFVTFRIAASDAPAAWPPQRSYTADYLVSRIAAPIEPAPAPPPAVRPTVERVIDPRPAAKLQPPARAMVPPPRRVAATAPGASGPRDDGGPRAGVLGDRGVLDDIAGRNLRGVRERFGEVAGPGPAAPRLPPGRVTRDDGEDPRRRHVPRPGERLDIGTLRDPVVCAGAACGGPPPIYAPPAVPPPPDRPTLTGPEIEKEIVRRAGLYRACYQAGLNRNPALAGTLVVRFTITAAGAVRNARFSSGTLADPDVRDCVLRNIATLAFPAKGGATVTYPFAFSPGA